MEYEDRRDADDAYHDMHNKRIGRDDILKIEVSPAIHRSCYRPHRPYADASYSGPALLLLPLGASILAVTVTVALRALLAAGLPAPGALATTLLARMTVASVTVTTIATAVTLATARDLRTAGKPSTMLNTEIVASSRGRY